MATITANNATEQVSTSLRQNTSKQDFVTSGTALDENDIEYKYLVVADGHGAGSKKDTVINFIRQYDWNAKLKHKKWYVTFTLEFNETLTDTIGVGSTLSVIRIYSDKFECWWIGDSSTRIYKNGDEIWRSLDNDADIRCEHIKLIKKGFSLKPEHKPCVLTPSTITMVPSFRVILGPRDKVAMTRCLGHNNMTGNNIEFASIPRETNESYKLIVGSDGFWDLVCDTDTINLSDREAGAQKLMNWILERWKQQWTYFHLTGLQKINFPEWNVDDICIGVFTS